ncbi:UDP-N-acetylglucosamine 4,6-dehydratase (inverting) [Candidatus Kaiserbacteria bacterium CG10_big_fil_rev_8_21_14_0_10_59_10]|uniref:UDP-N-acetylglucosamine 4,6-dehydratase (Inverting) n=1 Tax=Candidatus Kaiserbacteria bacterium CG10_big_fil_rev_8_21_14_0_10_59_10 TaxID=1974612 RepID=A0A2H0U7T3_9BACT|nr:MAG: UDP-N-acetylglucosamine 4,6-dehydratase (inverting) [Candidatus Kaiserbacteria bacterium CG10_big_fil_rev_8_21_14_0_10_59_10]
MNSSFWAEKSVLITGGTGTFGYAFIARLLQTKVSRIIVFSRDEFKQSELRRAFEDDERLRFFLGDVRDKERLMRAFRDVDFVVHAAALKQVPALEYNPMEAVKTNVLGTQNVIEAALDAGVARVLFTSSDKAVHPVNLYGATKLCAERLTIAANVYRRSGAQKPRFSVMRYGNILGSRGSLLEVVEKQRSSGTITLTDDRMTRFWLRIERVMDYVIEALEQMHGGEIFVPKMESVKVVDIIKCLAPDCSVRVVGIRPGEKLHETLITQHEAGRTRDIGSMYVISPEQLQFDDEPPVQGAPVGVDFIYASDNPRFLRSVEHAPRILAGGSEGGSGKKQSRMKKSARTRVKSPGRAKARKST